MVIMMLMVMIVVVFIMMAVSSGAAHRCVCKGAPVLEEKPSGGKEELI